MEKDAEFLIKNKDAFTACVEEFWPERTWELQSLIGSAYNLALRPAEALPYLEKAFNHIPEEVTLDRETRVNRIALALPFVSSLGHTKDFKRALALSKTYSLETLELRTTTYTPGLISVTGWVYFLMNQPGKGTFYSKLTGAAIYAEGENAAENQTWKNDLTRSLTRSNRTGELALFDKLPAGPSPEDISPFSPARVLMVGPEIALFDRFERLATALQQAAASDDPATLHAARENMRAWMDEVERELK